MDQEDEAMLAGVAVGDMVPASEEQRERLTRLAAAGYVILVYTDAMRADISLGPVYRLTVRGRAYLEKRERKGN